MTMTMVNEEHALHNLHAQIFNLMLLTDSFAILMDNEHNEERTHCAASCEECINLTILCARDETMPIIMLAYYY